MGSVSEAEVLSTYCYGLRMVQRAARLLDAFISQPNTQIVGNATWSSVVWQRRAMLTFALNEARVTDDKACNTAARREARCPLVARWASCFAAYG